MVGPTAGAGSARYRNLSRCAGSTAVEGGDDAFCELVDTCRAQLAEESPQDLRSLVSTLRALITNRANRPFFRLFDEVNALAQTQPDRFPGFGHASVYDWLPQFTELLGPSSPNDATAQARATLALAVIRGLMLDDNATGDHARIDGPFAVFDAL